MQDIRVALRQLRNAPAFTMTVILTIALGIGANTAIFTLVHAILMKSLPVGDPKSLYRIGDKADCCVYGSFPNETGDFDLFSFELYKQFREAAPEFEQLAAMQAGLGKISVRSGTGLARTETSEYVSGNYFATLGIGSFAGRVLSPADDAPNAAPAAVMSYQAWQSDYASDPAIVGATFYMQSQPVTIVGIAPPGFFGDRIVASPPALWLPLAAEPLLQQTNSILNHADQNWLYVIGRLKPGVAAGVLQQKLSGRLRDWLRTQDNYTRNGGASQIAKQHIVLAPGGAGIQSLQQQAGKGLYLLLAISGLVLLVTCANVANLLLARGSKRKTETSIRMALGAARHRLVRQMLTESILLACLGGLAGLVVAYAGTKALLALAFPDSPHNMIDSSPSLAVLGFAFLLSLVTGVTFGIVPAWITSNGDPAEALRGVNRSTGERGSLPQKSLIVFQAALSLVLLVGASLLTKSLENMEHQNFGIKTSNRYVLHIDPAGAGYTPEKLAVLYRKLKDQFSELPGMERAGLALYSPMEGANWGLNVFVQGRSAPDTSDEKGSSLDRVSPGFFEAVGQPVLRGRDFTENDSGTSPLVAVVNETFVKKFFPKEDPIGRHFGVFSQEYAGAYEIVGVVADAKYAGARDEVFPMYFRPLSQWQKGITNPTSATIETETMYMDSITMHFHTVPQNLDALVRRTLANIDPNLTVIDLRSLDYQVNGNFNQERLVARLATLFGLLTLVIASVGLYGITSYQVSRRTSEIGLRMALGANRNRVVTLVMRAALVQVGIGLLIGIPIALIGARAMVDQLYAVTPYDPVSLGIAIVVLSAAAALAGFLPARRAATIDPMQALRIR